jgi:glycerol-3-phosphate dehydrogenase (NAD(P)+)
VTCTSRHSRNHTVGERLGKGEAIQEIMSSMTMVAEGVWNAKVVYALAKRANVSMPITEAVYGLCYENLSVKEAVIRLISRDAKPEH